MPFPTIPQELRDRHPLRVQIVTSNDYGLPIGKTFPLARRKDGDASPYPIEIFSFGGNHKIYQMKLSEVEISNANS